MMSQIKQPHVTVLDYGVGNLLSVKRAFEKSGADVLISDRKEDILRAERLVLPGVGAFGDCVSALNSRGFKQAIIEFADTGKPLLGICVGMQLLCEVGEEYGEHEGLGLIEGRVKHITALSSEGFDHKIPHIGWRELELPRQQNKEWWSKTPFEDVEPGECAYFVHSYTAVPVHDNNRLVDSYYGGTRIAAAIRKGHIFGTQFHPEKSGQVGLKIIKNFLQSAS